MFKCKIGCVILASGNSKRFGRNKLIADLGGQPLVRYSVSIANMDLFSNRILVTRSEDTALACEGEVNICIHNLPSKAEAIRLGISRLCEADEDLDGIIFLQADQPLLRKKTVRRLCETFNNNPGNICRLVYKGKPGTPVIFPRILFPELMEIKDGNGGISVIKNHPELVVDVEAEDLEEMTDIDTANDLLKAEKFLSAVSRTGSF